MITKMPVPMIAPRPSAVRSSAPTARRSSCSFSCVSATSRSTGLVAKTRSRRGWPSPRPPAQLSARGGDRRDRPPRAPDELDRDVAEQPLATGPRDERADDDQVGVVLLGEQQHAVRTTGPCSVCGVASTPSARICSAIASAASRGRLRGLRPRDRRERLDVDAVGADHVDGRARLLREAPRPRPPATAGRPRPSRPPRSAPRRLPVGPTAIYPCGAAKPVGGPSGAPTIVCGSMPPFKLDSVYSPTADQPTAIERIVEAVEAGARGVTCSAPPAPARR